MLRFTFWLWPKGTPVRQIAWTVVRIRIIIVVSSFCTYTSLNIVKPMRPQRQIGPPLLWISRKCHRPLMTIIRHTQIWLETKRQRRYWGKNLFILTKMWIKDPHRGKHSFLLRVFRKLNVPQLAIFLYIWRCKKIKKENGLLALACLWPSAELIEMEKKKVTALLLHDYGTCSQPFLDHYKY